MQSDLLTDINKIDFGIPSQALGYGTLLFHYANSCGFGNNLSAKDRGQLKLLARQWICGVESSIDYMPVEDALGLIMPWDYVQRFILGRVPDRTFTLRYVSEALDARIHGNQKVDVYKLCKLIGIGLNGKDKGYFGKPLEWHTLMLDKWHKEFRKGIYEGTEHLSDYDNINRVARLLNENLWAFELEQDSFKKLLFKNHKTYFDKALEYDCRTIAALLELLNAGIKYMPLEDRADRSSELCSILSEKTDSPFIRAAMEYAIATNKEYC